MSKSLERKLSRLALVAPGVLRSVGSLATSLRACFYLIDDWRIAKIALVPVSVSYRVAGVWGPPIDHAAFVGKTGSTKFLLDPSGGIFTHAERPFIGNWSLVVPRPNGEALIYAPRRSDGLAPLDMGADPAEAVQIMRRLRDAMEGLSSWQAVDNPDSSGTLSDDGDLGWAVDPEDDRPTSPDSPWARGKR